MVEVLSKRVFEYEGIKQYDYRGFVSAAQWAAYARLIPFVEAILKELDNNYGQPEQSKMRQREFWKGNHTPCSNARY